MWSLAPIKYDTKSYITTLSDLKMDASTLTFHLHEDRCFVGQLNWIRDETQLRFSGADELQHFDTFRNKHLPCISTTPEQLAEFADALNLLDVWTWRDQYRSEDCGTIVDDGYNWRFTAQLGDLRCKSAGYNAVPSFADPQKTSVDNSGRYGLLIASFCDVFRIRIPGYNC
ncbi:hypothetical protein [Novipirellula maiorica]|nr:hypothetical protein [Rhodopirellula maiorica]